LAYPVRQYRLLKFANTESLSKTKRNLTFRMGQKLSSKLLFRSSPNTDGFYTFYISQCSVATQLRCGGMFRNHFTTNFSRNIAVKKNLKIGQYLAKIWTKLCGLLFWATLYKSVRRLKRETARVGFTARCYESNI